MARSSRGRGRKSRRNVDWVVNDLTYDFQIPYDLPNNTQVFMPLTIPKFAVSYVDPTVTVGVPAFNFPEQDSGQVAYAVRGQILASPFTWVAGDQWNVFYRIAKFPVEYQSGFDAVIDPAYELDDAQFANERFLWQHIQSEHFAFQTLQETVQVNWKGVCKIEPNEALFMVVMNRSNGTIRTILRPFLRTLMRADG